MNLSIYIFVFLNFARQSYIIFLIWARGWVDFFLWGFVWADVPDLLDIPEEFLCRLLYSIFIVSLSYIYSIFMVYL